MNNTFISFWLNMQTHNPNLSDDNRRMSITVGEFKRMAEKFYNMGCRDTAAVAKILQDKEPSNDFYDTFMDILKGKKK